MRGYNFSAPCLVCGKLSKGGNKCEEHRAAETAQHDAARARRKKQTGQYSGDYRRRAKIIRDSAVVCHICREGYKPYDPWQADHLIPGDPNSPLAPAHKSCNESRGNKKL